MCNEIEEKKNHDSSLALITHLIFLLIYSDRTGKFYSREEIKNPKILFGWISEATCRVHLANHRARLLDHDLVETDYMHYDQLIQTLRSETKLANLDHCVNTLSDSLYKCAITLMPPKIRLHAVPHL